MSGSATEASLGRSSRYSLRSRVMAAESEVVPLEEVQVSDVLMPRLLYVRHDSGFGLYARFFTEQCGMQETQDVASAGVVLENEFELKRNVALQGWAHFHQRARVLFLPGVVMLDDKIEFAQLLADAPYHPETYCHKVPSGADVGGWWLDKPARGSSGRGIRFVYNPQGWAKEGHVLQRYACDPLLFRDSIKFDLRVLALVTADGFAYVYPDAVMRCAGQTYAPLPRVRTGTRMLYLADEYERVHLTNVCVQAKYDTSQSYVNILSDHPDLHGRLMPTCEQLILDVLCRWTRHIQTHDEGLLDTAGAASGSDLCGKGFRVIGFDLLPMRDGSVTFIEANYQPGMAMDGPLGRFYARAMTSLLRCVVDPSWAAQHMVCYAPVRSPILARAKRAQQHVVARTICNERRIAPDILVISCQQAVAVSQWELHSRVAPAAPAVQMSMMDSTCLLFGTDEDARCSVERSPVSGQHRQCVSHDVRAPGRRKGELIAYGIVQYSRELTPPAPSDAALHDGCGVRVYDPRDARAKAADSGSGPSRRKHRDRRTRYVLPLCVGAVGGVQGMCAARHRSPEGLTVVGLVAGDRDRGTTDTLVIESVLGRAASTPPETLTLTSFTCTNRGDVSVNPHGLQVTLPLCAFAHVSSASITGLTESLVHVLAGAGTFSRRDEFTNVDCGVALFLDDTCLCTSWLRQGTLGVHATDPLVCALLAYVPAETIAHHASASILEAVVMERNEVHAQLKQA